MNLSPKFKRLAHVSHRFVPRRLKRPRVVFLTSGQGSSDTRERKILNTAAVQLFHRPDAEPAETQGASSMWREFVRPGPRCIWASGSPDPQDPQSLHVQVIITATQEALSIAHSYGDDKTLRLQLEEEEVAALLQRLYNLRPLGPNRHILHGLRIADLEQLAVKRRVAMYWCRLWARLAASNALVPLHSETAPALPMLALPPPEGASMWMRQLHGVLLDCYGLTPPQENLNEAGMDWGATDFARFANNATRSLVKLRALQSLLPALRRTGRTVTRAAPGRLLGVLAAASIARDGIIEHNRARRYGEALIDLAEAHWRQQLSKP